MGIFKIQESNSYLQSPNFVLNSRQVTPEWYHHNYEQDFPVPLFPCLQIAKILSNNVKAHLNILQGKIKCYLSSSAFRWSLTVKMSGRMTAEMLGSDLWPEFDMRSSERFTNPFQLGVMLQCLTGWENNMETWASLGKGQAKSGLCWMSISHSTSCNAQLADTLFLPFIAPQCSQRLPHLPAAKESKYLRSPKV